MRMKASKGKGWKNGEKGKGERFGLQLIKNWMVYGRVPTVNDTEINDGLIKFIIDIIWNEKGDEGKGKGEEGNRNSEAEELPSRATTTALASLSAITIARGLPRDIGILVVQVPTRHKSAGKRLGNDGS